MVMFDSLNRHMLPPYGCDWVHAPNFQRLTNHCVTFDKSFVGSMPCMPARRELHTGRLNFLHRSWGPIEPFDDSMPEILRKNGVYTHLVSDHLHYWEDGGCTYHHRYSTWENIRGKQGDLWIGQVAPEPPAPNSRGGNAHDFSWYRQDRINRKYMVNEQDFPQARTMKAGLEFIERNKDEDSWFLQIETFDPHEPYHVPENYMKLYSEIDYEKYNIDWPGYEPVNEESRQWIPHLRHLNAALTSMCDHYLGKVLDTFDRLNLWEDTMLIVNTDHGFLLGEHDWWAKCVQPFYNEIAHTPLFIWDPRTRVKDERRNALVQTIDIAPTLLDFFGVEIPKDMMGFSLKNTIQNDQSVRDYLLFGLHGAHVNITDGNHVYMRAPNKNNSPLFNYTHMPTHMANFFSVDELHDIDIAEPFSFTKGCRTMKIAAKAWGGMTSPFETLLFDIEHDPGQNNPINNPEVEKRMIDKMIELMKENDAPQEQYKRLGL